MAGTSSNRGKIDEIQRSSEELSPDDSEATKGGVLIGLLLPAVQSPVPKLDSTRVVVNHEEQY